MTEEIWKDVNGWEGLYQVSNLGRVRSVPHYDWMNRPYKGKVLTPVRNGNGYLRVNMTNGKIRRLSDVHRLVASAFIPNPNGYPEVNHKDEDKDNNHVDNLEWCTEKYNTNYGTGRKRAGAKVRGEKNPFAKLKEKDVIEIRKITKENGCSPTIQKLVSEKFSISERTVRHIYHGDIWKHLLKEETA